jgi:hypothetical protein
MQIKNAIRANPAVQRRVWSLSKHCQLGEEAGADRIGRAFDCRTTDWPGSRGVAALNQDLNIWDAYATIHLLMPDGSMKLGGEAVAEVLRNLPSTRWFTWTFAISVFGTRPFQALLNLAYAILADVRPVFGCESCGTPSPWVRPIRWIVKWVESLFGGIHHPGPSRHFSSLPARGRPPQPHHI